MASREQIEQWARDPRVRVMLDTLAKAEGTAGARNEYAVYGGNKAKQLQSLAAHPQKQGAWEYRWTDGRPNGMSTASGRYQFTRDTWNEQQKKLGLSDFGPQSQDLAAISLMAQAGAIPDILAGNYHKAAQKLGGRWASLPTSKHAQAKRTSAQFDKYLAEAKANPSAFGNPAAPTSGTPQPVLAATTQPQLPTVKPQAVAASTTPAWDNIAAPLSKDLQQAIMVENYQPMGRPVEFYEPPEWKRPDYLG